MPLDEAVEMRFEALEHSIANIASLLADSQEGRAQQSASRRGRSHSRQRRGSPSNSRSRSHSQDRRHSRRPVTSFSSGSSSSEGEDNADMESDDGDRYRSRSDRGKDDSVRHAAPQAIPGPDVQPPSPPPPRQGSTPPPPPPRQVTPPPSTRRSRPAAAAASSDGGKRGNNWGSDDSADDQGPPAPKVRSVVHRNSGAQGVSMRMSPIPQLADDQPREATPRPLSPLAQMEADSTAQRPNFTIPELGVKRWERASVLKLDPKSSIYDTVVLDAQQADMMAPPKIPTDLYKLMSSSLKERENRF